MSRLIAAIEGDLRKVIEGEVRGARQAVTAGIRQATEGLKGELRGQVVRAGLGTRLARSWRGRVYPNEGLDAAGTVWSKAPRLVRAFDEGAVIRGRSGLWLAIPTPAAPRRGVGGKRISPASFPEHSLGRLRFVYRPGRPALLVVDEVRVGQRGVRRASATARRTGRGLASAVMFVLLPQVRLRKRLDVAGATRAWLARTPNLIVRAWPEGSVRGRR